MLRNPKVQAFVVLAVGVLLGYGAATGTLQLNRSADAAQTGPAKAADSTPEQIGNPAACCTEGNLKATLLAQAGKGAAVASTQSADTEEVIIFEVLLPADAVLEIDGTKTTSTGETRSFKTPPLKVGGRYNYALKATAGGKEVKREIHISHGAANAFDLRPDFLAAGAGKAAATALTQKPANSKKPNIVFIMGDDVGWFNIGAYHRGIMSGKTPNLDKLASQGVVFTDYYAEASCTAGRANFITGEIPLRTGLTTVGQAGADVGMPAQACTLATALKAQGYTTGQFGKNHLGDLNKFLPTLHGFDEFFGYLYHLDAMSDPYWYSFPNDQAFRDKYGPRNLVHCWATDKDDTTEMPRWGKIGKQRIVDEGPLPPFPDMSNVPNMHDISVKAKYDMTTFDEVLVESSKGFMDKAKKEGKPFFLWHNTTRMHVWTFLSKKYGSMMNSQTNFGLEEAGMKQLDDSVGAIMKHLDDIGEAENTILIFSTDNGAEVFTWPDGGMTPFKATKGTVMEGGFRVPCIARWPGHVKPGTVENGLFSGLDWFPTLTAAAGNPDITDQLLKGVKLGDREYKNHLDGYNQMELLEGKGPTKRHELFYFGGPKLGALRIDDFKFQFYQQPLGWPGPKVTTDMPGMVNLRQDPFERTPSINGETLNNLGGGYMNDFYAREFWRFVLVQQRVAELAKTAIDYPPMQDPASFNLDAVKKQIDEMIKAHAGQ